MDSLDNMLIPRAITGIIFPLFHLQRLKYLDMANMAPPEFKDVRKRVFNFDSGRFDWVNEYFGGERNAASGTLWTNTI
ncbi:hypothetical protein BY457_10383 [Marinilabilia salmonicolor]|nr:hypothetical protein BY457_10383 [Marinilabilia salmonicolor]